MGGSPAVTTGTVPSAESTVSGYKVRPESISTSKQLHNPVHRSLLPSRSQGSMRWILLWEGGWSFPRGSSPMSHTPPDGTCARCKRSVAPARSSFLRCLRGVGPCRNAPRSMRTTSPSGFSWDRSIWPPACIQGAPNSVFMSLKENLVCLKDIPVATENDGAFWAAAVLPVRACSCVARPDRG